MPRRAIDTSVLVAAVAGWHEDNRRCARALDEALSRPPVIVPQHALLEAYSVLTRLPAPHRLSPATALSVLEQTLRDGAEVVALDGADTWTFLADQPGAGIAGGALYDAIIIRTSLAAGAESILTLNARHFERLAPPELAVVTPG